MWSNCLLELGMDLPRGVQSRRGEPKEQKGRQERSPCHVHWSDSSRAMLLGTSASRARSTGMRCC